MAAGAAAWKLAFELSPIILVEGLAAFMPGAMLPLMLATEAINFPLGILTSGDLGSLDDAFAHFSPLPGATVINQQIATYPFANMIVAANATVQQPRQISMHMTAPARGSFGYWTKLAKMTLLIEVLKKHNDMAGMYHVVTPSVLYTNCILKNMRDVSSAQTKQVQNVWQLDFEKPLLTLEDAGTWTTKLNNVLKQLDGGQQINGMPSVTGTASATASAIPTSSPTLIPVSTSNVLGGR